MEDGLTCCTGHTSHSGGHQSSDTQHMWCTAHRPPQEPEPPKPEGWQGGLEKKNTGELFKKLKNWTFWFQQQPSWVYNTQWSPVYTWYWKWDLYLDMLSGSGSCLSFFFFLHLVLLMCSCFPPRDWISGFPSKICMWVIWVGSKSAPDFPQSSVSCWVKGKLCTLCETLFDYKFLITFSLFFPVIPLSSP